MEGKSYRTWKMLIFSPFSKGLISSPRQNRCVSLLPTLSRVWENIPSANLWIFYFSKYLCGFRRGHSTHHCLLFMLEKLKWCSRQGASNIVLLTDLPKAFNSISHELLIAKLYAHRFSINSFKLIGDYLSDRMQRTKVGSIFSIWWHILSGGQYNFAF